MRTNIEDKYARLAARAEEQRLLFLLLVLQP
jgi:hypothetical protein